MAVSGAWVVPATIVAIPTSAYALTLASPIRPMLRRVRPKAPPSIAPMNREGANTPPEPPLPSVRQVARNLSPNRRTTDVMVQSSSPGPMAVWITGYPFPKKGGIVGVPPAASAPLAHT